LLNSLSFKVWNYLGENKFSYALPPNNELWQVQWQPGVYEKKPVVKKTTVVKEESKIEMLILHSKSDHFYLRVEMLFLAKAYVPPHLRGANKASTFNSKLHNDDEKPDNKLKIKPCDAVLDAEKKIKNLKKVLLTPNTSLHTCLS
jgi:hypothetical protein